MERKIILWSLILGAVLGAGWFYPRQRAQIMEVAGPEVKKTAGVQYSSAPAYKTQVQTNLLLDVYQPVGDTRVGRPAIILVHGGGFGGGNRGIYDEESKGGLFGWGKYFGERGYVVFSVDYRLGDKLYKLDDPDLMSVIGMATSDVLTSVRWVRQNAVKYGVDPDKIAVGGNSAGAILALYSAYHRGAEGDNVSNQGVSSKVSAAISLSGALAGTDLGAIGADSPPAIMFAGSDDKTVPYAWSQAVKDKLKEVGVRVDWYSYPGAGHEVAGYAQVAPQIAQFLNEVMNTVRPSVVPTPTPITTPTSSPSPTPSPTTTAVVASPTVKPTAKPSATSTWVAPTITPMIKPIMAAPTAKPRVTPQEAIKLERMTPEDFVWHGQPGQAIVESNNDTEMASKPGILQVLWEKLKQILGN